MRALTILGLAAAFLYVFGWPMTFPIVPVVSGILVATGISGWALLRRRRPHAAVAFPMLAVAATLVTVGPIDMSVNRHAAFGVRVVPVVYGMPSPELFERGEAGELDLRGCIMQRFPKAYTVRIGLNPVG